jgi:hypothetical protein
MDSPLVTMEPRWRPDPMQPLRVPVPLPWPRMVIPGYTKGHEDRDLCS